MKKCCYFDAVFMGNEYFNRENICLGYILEASKTFDRNWISAEKPARHIPLKIKGQAYFEEIGELDEKTSVAFKLLWSLLILTNALASNIMIQMNYFILRILLTRKRIKIGSHYESAATFVTIHHSRWRHSKIFHSYLWRIFSML